MFEVKNIFNKIKTCKMLKASRFSVFLKKENSRNRRIRARGTKTVDKLGIFFNLYGAGMVVLPITWIIVVYLDCDPIYHIFPTDSVHHPLAVLLRCVIIVWAGSDACYSAVAGHIILMPLVLHTKSLFEQLKSFKIIKIKSKSKSSQAVEFKDIDDIQLYVLGYYFVMVANEYIDVLLLFTLIPFALMDVTVNFALLRFFNELPLTLYMVDCLLVFILPTVLSLEFSQAGKTYDEAKSCIWQWKGKSRSRMSLRFKRTLACKPVGYTMANMFILTSGTITTYGKGVLECTIPINKELPWCLLRDHFFLFRVYAVERDDDDTYSLFALRLHFVQAICTHTRNHLFLLERERERE
jgi:hypothetical protein